MATAHEVWKQIENQAAAKRVALSADAMHELLGGDREALPRLGVCLSGGGWRAMTSGCALFDALSTPLPSKETHDGKGNVKLMDCISHAFGLSGGSWLLYNTLAGGAFNPFHHGFDPADDEAKRQERISQNGKNPWLYGKDHKFDPAIHRYKGLARALAKDTVDRGCHRGGLRKTLGFVTTTTNTDSTIAAALACKRLGESLVDRWSSFIANDILAWVDDDMDNSGGAGATTNLAAAAEGVLGGIDDDEPADASISSQPNPSSGAAGQSTKAQLQAAELRALFERDNQAKSRNVDLSSLGQLILDGKLPFMVMSAIANRSDAGEVASATTAELEAAKHKPRPGEGKFASAKRAYDWVEFSPFFVRNPATQQIVSNVAEVNALFSRGLADRVKLRLHHYMGICGSAFACDIGCALPASISRRFELPHSAVIGRGTSDVFGPSALPMASQEASIGTLRDAGIDFNVPLPPMLAEAGRSFDVLLVMDAGGGSTRAYELQRAVELGYLRLMSSNDVVYPFNSRQRVKVYRGEGGFPTIVYFLGLTQRGTHQIIQSEQRLLADVESLRKSAEVMKAVLIQELRNAQRFKKLVGPDGIGASSLLSGAASAALCAFDEASSALSFDDDDATQDEAGGGGGDEEPAQRRLDVLLGELPPVTRNLMHSVTAQVDVSSPFDAYFEVEKVIMSAVGDVAKAKLLTGQLQELALKHIVKPHVPSAAAETQRFFDSLPPELRDAWLECGLFEKPSADDELMQADVASPVAAVEQPPQPAAGTIRIPRPFIAYFSAAALVHRALTEAASASHPAHFDDPFAVSRQVLSVSLHAASVPLDLHDRVWQLAAAGARRLGLLNDLKNIVLNPASRLRHDLSEILKSINTDRGPNADLLRTNKRLDWFARNIASVVPSNDEAAKSAVTTLLTQELEYACGLTGIAHSKVQKASVKDRLCVAFAAGASACGHIRLLNTCFVDSPALFANNSADAKIVFGRAAEAPNAHRVQAFLFAQIGVSITFADVCELGLTAAAREMVSLPANRDRKDETLKAIEKQHEEVVSLIFEHAATPEFRRWIASECSKRQLLWPAIMPAVEEIDVPQDSSMRASFAVAFAERCPKLRKVTTTSQPGNASASPGLADRLAALKSTAAARASASPRFAAATAKAEVLAAEAQARSIAAVTSAKTAAMKFFGRK